ncbi:MAG: septum formation protein Maf [Betaproteobacteria bacterium]|nr:septum formation protein Maf [Betaproteobacteria bacterium]
MPLPQRNLVLASSSLYRRRLLERLGLAFECTRPEADETPLPGESFERTASRLAELKARAAAPHFRDALIIGSDQVASCAGVRMDKPGSHENAARQLRHMSGRSARFDTAVCLLDTATGRLASKNVSCEVVFRVLSSALIEQYLAREQPYDCAGSAKSEGLGIALIAAMRTDDPTSLIGLPLIALTDLLAEFGLPVLAVD